MCYHLSAATLGTIEMAKRQCAIASHLGGGKIGLRGGGGRGSPPKERGGGVWQWGSCDRTLGTLPITSQRG